jgi:hypothetical protein
MPLPPLPAKRSARAGLEPIRPFESPAQTKAVLATSLAVGSAGVQHLMARPQFAARAPIGSVASVYSLVCFREMPEVMT